MIRKRVTISKKQENTNNSVIERDLTDESQVNLFDLTRLFLRRKKLIFWVTTCVTLLVAVSLFMTPNRYRSRATILPSGGNDKMADLKRLAGFGNLVSGDENSSELFPVVLQSPTVRDALLERTFHFERNSQREMTTLPDFFGEDNHDLQRALLASVTDIETDRRTGVITISVETRYPTLSRAIVTAYLEELEDYNRNKRKSRAKENVRYLEQQLTGIRANLENAEDDLEMFQNANRNWVVTSDPELLKTLARLKRDVEAKTQTFLLLGQEYGIAKLEVQKDTPIVRVLDSPTLPELKSGPYRLKKILLVAFLTFGVMLFIVFMMDVLFKRARGSEREAYEALRTDFSQSFPVTNRLLTKFERGARTAELTHEERQPETTVES